MGMTIPERGKRGYPIKYMVTIGDYRKRTPTELYFGASRAEAQAVYAKLDPADFPQLFRLEVDHDFDFLDSQRLAP
jgi:hypothetical protein